MAEAAAARARQIRDDANKMAMKIPFFHGTGKSDDALPIKEFIKRFETAVAAMNLADEAEKCKMFAAYLRGPAVSVFDNMKKLRRNSDDWNTVKEYFLTKFRGKVDVNEFTSKITKLTQHKDESTMLFGNRCYETIHDHLATTPFPEAEHLIAGMPALNQAQKDSLNQNYVINISQMLARTFFVNGVRDNIRTNLLNKAPETFEEAMDEAARLEKVQQDKGELKHITELADEDDSVLEQMNELELDQETIDAINRQRASRGQAPYKRGFRNSGNGFRSNPNQRPRSSNSMDTGNSNYNKCRYCHLPNHMQDVCRKRMAAGALCVDRQGVPLKNQPKAKVQEVKEQRQEQRPEETFGLAGYMQELSGTAPVHLKF